LNAKRSLPLPTRVRSALDLMGHGLPAAATAATAAPTATPEEPVLLARPFQSAVPDLAPGPAPRMGGEVSAPLSPQAIEDSALVARVQTGDMAAFEELFHKYKGAIYRTALAITRDAGVAEEVLQDCFYKTYCHIDRIQPDVPLSPWLHRVAVNLSCNALKRKRRWFEPIENLAERLFADPHHSPEHLCEQGELQGTIRDIVNNLPLKHRVVVVLHYLQDLSLPEIAEILDCPVGTVKSRLHYARKVLKLEIEARYLAEGSALPGGSLGVQESLVL
jgi:RNA polymerase sigma-70 factor (ECF subfamily)